jgi:hypothetical protein
LRRSGRSDLQRVTNRATLQGVMPAYRTLMRRNIVLVETRLANMPRCLIGMEACVGAHHLSRSRNYCLADIAPRTPRPLLRCCEPRATGPDLLYAR